MESNNKTILVEFPSHPAHPVDAVDRLLEYAASVESSDVHIDPHHDGLSIRLRIDGQLEEVGRLPKGLHEGIIARLKILSGVRTDLHVVPQDGRWRGVIDGDEYNIRSSFMPTYYGENAVLRLLPVDAYKSVSFAELGFAPDHVALIDRGMRQPHGLVVVTGPTGCGKTTTLHACLALKVQEPISIITLEDPIEYEIRGVRQVHIRSDCGVTFALGLRAALRQDPDVIMVGEVRDAETAHVAIHTALTGHLVFSTLHTNSAIETIPRLVDMGVDHYLLAATLRLVVAQRLVRRVCHMCAGEGCSECRDSGYKGRSLIAEVCTIDDTIRSFISHKEPLSTYTDYLGSQGFRSLRDDGREKVEWGVTTREEIIRVLHI